MFHVEPFCSPRKEGHLPAPAGPQLSRGTGKDPGGRPTDLSKGRPTTPVPSPSPRTKPPAALCRPSGGGHSPIRPSSPTLPPGRKAPAAPLPAFERAHSPCRRVVLPAMEGCLRPFATRRRGILHSGLVADPACGEQPARGPLASLPKLLLSTPARSPTLAGQGRSAPLPVLAAERQTALRTGVAPLRPSVDLVPRSRMPNRFYRIAPSSGRRESPPLPRRPAARGGVAVPRNPMAPPFAR